MKTNKNNKVRIILSLLKTVILCFFGFICFPIALLLPNWKHYLFVVNTGRSGSKSFARMFNDENSVYAVHEPYPSMLNFLKLKNRKLKVFNTIIFLFIKYPKIKILKLIYFNRTTYVESNHMFTYNFMDIAFNLFKYEMKIVRLLRPEHEIARSMYNLCASPDTSLGSVYYSNPNQIIPKKVFEEVVHNCVLKFGPVTKGFFYALFHCAEIEMKFQSFITKRNTKYIEINMNDINEVETIKSSLFQLLGLQLNLTPAILNRKSNEKQERLGRESAREMYVYWKECFSKWDDLS